MFTLDTQLADIPRARRFLPKLKKLGIETIKELLWHFPARYEDFSHVCAIEELKPNQQATVRGTLVSINVRRAWRRRRMTIIEALVNDETGSINVVWFNQPYLGHTLKSGQIINLSGKVTARDNKLILVSPIYELVGKDDTKHTARIIPIYSETKGLTSKGIRYLIKPLLEDIELIEEIIPEDILRKESIQDINTALRQIHFPDTQEKAAKAKKRFAFEDLLFLQLHNLKQRSALSKQLAPNITIDADYLNKLISNLPFQLTQSQKQTLRDILKDTAKKHPMNRLLQGDVGSGKTIVIALASLAVAKNGLQAALMAPTAILARQHYETFTAFFPQFEGGIGLLTSNEAQMSYGERLTTSLKKEELRQIIAKNKIKIIIGTHALIQKYVNFPKLALIVVDEQHRFGVKQRAALIQSTRTTPHFLSMSATPIPRTLSLTIFGDLDLSLITELPKNRKPIITKVVSPLNREKAYCFIQEQARQGRQIFVICPRITASENNDGELLDARKRMWLEVKNVEEEYKKLSTQIFTDLNVVMLHSKLKPAEKEQVMRKFANGDADILVSTSVVEVGVDVSNATIMMIEGAERFGLAQLYQFRGRVGRGKHQSYCLLFTDSTSPAIERRLVSIVKAKNGLELAEKDLQIRGPGEFLGKSQTGIPDLAMKAIQNPELVRKTREIASEIIKNDPEFKNHPGLKRRLKEFQLYIHRE